MIKVNHHEQREALVRKMLDEHKKGEAMQVSQNGDSGLAVSIIGKKNKVLRTHFINIKGDVRTVHGARHNRHAA